MHSNKGFGKATQPKKKTEDDLPVEGGTSRQLKRAGRSKGKNQMRMGESGAAAQQQRSASLAPSTTTTSQPSPESLTDAIEFEQRLKALKAEADRKKAEVASKNLSTSVLDGPPKYDDPPPLSKTLFMGGSQDAGKAALDKEYSDSSFGYVFFFFRIITENMHANSVFFLYDDGIAVPVSWALQVLLWR